MQVWTKHIQRKQVIEICHQLATKYTKNVWAMVRVAPTSTIILKVERAILVRRLRIH